MRVCPTQRTSSNLFKNSCSPMLISPMRMAPRPYGCLRFQHRHVSRAPDINGVAVHSCPATYHPEESSSRAIAVTIHRKTVACPTEAPCGLQLPQIKYIYNSNKKNVHHGAKKETTAPCELHGILVSGYSLQQQPRCGTFRCCYRRLDYRYKKGVAQVSRTHVPGAWYFSVSCGTCFESLLAH